jgi:hypothetical protein
MHGGPAEQAPEQLSNASNLSLGATSGVTTAAHFILEVLKQVQPQPNANVPSPFLNELSVIAKAALKSIESTFPSIDVIDSQWPSDWQKLRYRLWVTNGVTHVKSLDNRIERGQELVQQFQGDKLPKSFKIGTIPQVPDSPEKATLDADNKLAAEVYEKRVAANMLKGRQLTLDKHKLLRDTAINDQIKAFSEHCQGLLQLPALPAARQRLLKLAMAAFGQHLRSEIEDYRSKKEDADFVKRQNKKPQDDEKKEEQQRLGAAVSDISKPIKEWVEEAIQKRVLALVKPDSLIPKQQKQKQKPKQKQKQTLPQDQQRKRQQPDARTPVAEVRRSPRVHDAQQLQPQEQQQPRRRPRQQAQQAQQAQQQQASARGRQQSVGGRSYSARLSDPNVQRGTQQQQRKPQPQQQQQRQRQQQQQRARNDDDGGDDEHQPRMRRGRSRLRQEQRRPGRQQQQQQQQQRSLSRGSVRADNAGNANVNARVDKRSRRAQARLAGYYHEVQPQQQQQRQERL